MFEKIKAFFQARSLIKEGAAEVKTMDNQVKPGWQTTEFWTHNIATLVTIASTIAMIFGLNITPDQQIALGKFAIEIISALSALYGLYRTIVKFVRDWKAAKTATAPAVSSATVVATTVTNP